MKGTKEAGSNRESAAKKQAAAKEAAAKRAAAAEAARLAASTTLPVARKELDEEKGRLRQAWQLLDRARAKAANREQEESARAKPIPARGSDLKKLVALADPVDPEKALKEIPLRKLTQNPVRLAYDGESTYLNATVEQIQARVDAVKRERDRTQGLIDSIKYQGELGGPGLEKLSRKCDHTGVVVEACKPSPWWEGNLRFDTIVIMRQIGLKWPAIDVIGGWRPYDPYPDHPSGRAVDIMMPNEGYGDDVRLGDEIARYFQENAAKYGVRYILWKQSSWSTGDGLDDWSRMSNRGSRTANHRDHVHITVEDGKSGTIWPELVAAARAQAE
jgi:hypothetical protein